MLSTNTKLRRALRIAVAGSAIGICLAFGASPAAGQVKCDLNGAPGVPSGAQGTNSLVCGNPGGSFGVSDDLTAIGEGLAFSGDSVTVVGSHSFVTTVDGFNFDTYSPTGAQGSTAVGAYAVAAGTNNVVVGDRATIGQFTLSGGGGLIVDATASFATAIGSGAAVFESLGTAVGASAFIYGQNGTALGYNSVAFSEDATALGSQAGASGVGSVAIGRWAGTSGIGAIAIGGDVDGDTFGAGASADGAIAIGGDAQATAAGSVAIGAGSVANAVNTVSVGAAGSERRIVNVAAGVDTTDAVNVGQLNAVTGNVTALQTTVDTHTTQITAIQAVNTTQATQITALQATDAAFDTRIDTLELLAEGLDDRIDRVDDRASAGTAAAVALSGAMFLPGKSFNLTGNVGSYRGAHAAALQFGALVGDNVAVNAGIAHGFNKGGKTALRAGFTVGW